MKRVLTASFLHETNTFNPIPTTVEDARIRGLYFGDEVIAHRRNTATEIGGFIDGCQATGIELVPTVCAEPYPGGRVTRELYDIVESTIHDTLCRTEVNGVLLALHGAMVTGDDDDGEGRLLEAVRHVVGASVPIVLTLDLHATLTQRMLANADALTIYRTYPHIDRYERGCDAASLMARILTGDIHPVVALSKRPLLIGPPHNVLPTGKPMSLIYQRARELETSNSIILAACPAHGFMHQDVPEAGVGVVVTADGDLSAAQAAADELADMVFAHRREYFVDLPDAAGAIRMARLSDAFPVAIADSGDNIGAGTPGDGTALLREILYQDVDSAFVQIFDPAAARMASEAGIGSTVTIPIGGKSDPLYGPPVEVTGRVRMLFDGAFRNREGSGYDAGVSADMGLSARIDHGGVTVVVTSRRISPNNIMHANAMGVFPEDYRMTVCKGGLAFRDAYRQPRTASYIQSDTPGYSAADPRQFDYRHVRRPIFPLDDM